MTGEAEIAANSIVAEALKNVGVAQKDINLPPETEPSEPSGQEKGKPKLDGTLRGQVKGEALEDQEQETETPEPGAEEPPKPESDETVGQPLAKTEIEALIGQASSKFQSIMDTKINQLNLRMEQTVNALNQFFQTQEDSSISGLPESEQVLERLKRLEAGGKQPKIQIQQPINQQPAQFYQQLANFVDTVGLKIDDARIDWAPDTNDPQVGFNRFLGSIRKALTEDQTKVIQELKDNGDKEIQKLRKKTGVDKVSTSGAGGAGLPDLAKMTPLQKLEYAYAEQEQLNKQGGQ